MSKGYTHTKLRSQLGLCTCSMNGDAIELQKCLEENDSDPLLEEPTTEDISDWLS